MTLILFIPTSWRRRYIMDIRKRVVWQTFNTDVSDSATMKEKQPELRWQCLNCYRTFKGPDAEQKALDCCGSVVQGWWANYNKWGKQKWYGR